MSPTAICTRSRSSASMLDWVPLPLPWTPRMTYLRTSSGYRAIFGDLGRTIGSWLDWGIRSGRVFLGGGRLALAGLLFAEPEHPLAQPPQLGLERFGDQRPVGGEQLGVDEADDVVALALG